MGAGDAAAFSYDIGLFRGFQRALETDEVCGRPLDAFAFAITCCNVGKAAFGERNLRRKVDKHAGIVCQCAQLNRAKGSREELPCGVKGAMPLAESRGRASGVPHQNIKSMLRSFSRSQLSDRPDFCDISRIVKPDRYASDSTSGSLRLSQSMSGMTGAGGGA